MKLLLNSSGFRNEVIIQAFETLVDKPRAEINLIIINEAIKAEKGDHRWFAEELETLVHTFGGNLEFIDLQAHPLEYIKSRIDEADALFCFGGNADYLTQVFEKTGFAKILPQILDEKVWVGSSAGSCVLCYHETAETSRNVFEETPSSDHFLNIVPIVFLPHFHGYFKFEAPEVICESELTNLPVYAMSDNAALLVTGEPGHFNIRPIGEDYIIAKQGELQ